MEKKVLYGCVEEKEVTQHVFIELTQIGQYQKKKLYSAKRISFSFGRAERLFPLLKDKVKSNLSCYKNEIDACTPMTVNNAPHFEIVEDSPTYKYYIENYKEISIPFEIINYLFENYNGMKTMFNSILEKI